ncbi:MAG: YbhB/YbcL family Raf kinase inhibitor-like protein [Paracoccaceae bacterium]
MIRTAALSFASLMMLSGLVHAEMTLISADMAEGHALKADQVLDGFGCEGANKSPELSWSGAPDETLSYVVTVYDPDAPTGSGWWHWTLFNIPASATHLESGAGSSGGALPDGAVQGSTDFGVQGYGGACPPPGGEPHHYVFTVYALKVPNLPLDEGASGAMVSFMARGNALDQATLTVVYGR